MGWRWWSVEPLQPMGAAGHGGGRARAGSPAVADRARWRARWHGTVPRLYPSPVYPRPRTSHVGGGGPNHRGNRACGGVGLRVVGVVCMERTRGPCGGDGPAAQCQRCTYIDASPWAGPPVTARRDGRAPRGPPARSPVRACKWDSGVGAGTAGPRPRAVGGNEACARHRLLPSPAAPRQPGRRGSLTWPSDTR